MIELGISAAQFFAQCYEKQFFVRRSALKCRPVTWQHINSALFAWDPRDGLLHLFKNGRVPTEHYTEIFTDLSMQRSKIVKDVFYDFLRNGATLVLNRLETKSEPVHDLTMEIARFVGEKAVANGYAAFGGEGTFAKHWDTHDVFAVQLIGRKRWRISPRRFSFHCPSKEARRKNTNVRRSQSLTTT
nr:cupin domain-containing protein [uncultured Variovorax sp.]